MKDHVEIDHLTKYGEFRVNRDQVRDLEIWLKIHTNVSKQNQFDSKAGTTARAIETLMDQYFD